MKKIWVLIAFFGTFLSAGAQELRFGIFADPVLSWIKTDVTRIESEDPRIGINAGLMLDRFFTKNYAFSTGISICSLGGTLRYTTGKEIFRSSSDITSLPPNTSVKYKLQYLHVPLSIKMRTTQIGYSTFYAHVGLDPMINIKANADVGTQGIKNTGVRDEINSLYLGYHIGVGMEYQIVGNTNFTTGITYTNGVTDITDDNGNTTERSSLHFFQLRLGIIF